MTKGTGPASVASSVCTLAAINQAHTHSEPETNVENAEDTNAPEVNIAEYVQGLPEYIRNKIAGFLRTGDIDQDKIDIENIEHYLIVSRYCNKLKSVCEAKLLSTLNYDNCFIYLTLSERFDIPCLKINSKQMCDNFNVHRQDTIHTELSDKREYTRNSTCNKTYVSYNALFTCNTDSSTKQTLTALVLNSQHEIKCYRTLQKGKKVNKNFQCCCLQDHEEDPPYMMYSFGKCLWKYDPVLNKCRKLSSMKYTRSNFSLVAHNRRCYVIGGERKGKHVKDIEEYNPIKRSWKTVVELPTEGRVTSVASVSLGNDIYIFCSEQCDQDISGNKIVAYTFDTKHYALYKTADMIIAFSQVKVCVDQELIYLACDSGDFLTFDSRTRSFCRCRDQLIKSRDFGMYTDENGIFLAGGTHADGKCNNTIRQFCPATGSWLRLTKNLPDSMPVYGMCQVKVPSSYSIVPFYESKFFEKPLRM